MKRLLLKYLVCPNCRGALAADDNEAEEIVTGELSCSGCGATYQILHGIPILIAGGQPVDDPTNQLYSDIWTDYDPNKLSGRRPWRGYRAPATSNYELLGKASGWEIVEAGIGLDAGCGNGGIALGIAGGHPEVHVVGIDLSEGPFIAAKSLQNHPNADLIQGDLMTPPFVADAFDFAYSFGVLHHTPDPRRAFELLVRSVRPGGRITIFLYKDFSDQPVKRFFLLQVNRLRRFSRRLSPARLRRLCRIIAPFVFLLLTVPARLLLLVGLGKIAFRIPYGIFPTVGSVAASLEDRFGVPHEHRFSMGDLESWVEAEGLEDARVVDCLPWGFSGLVIAGRRARDGHQG